MKAAEKTRRAPGPEQNPAREFSDARRLTPAGFVGAPEFYLRAAYRWTAVADSGGPPVPRAGSWSIDFQ